MCYHSVHRMCAKHTVHCSCCLNCSFPWRFFLLKLEGSLVYGFIFSMVLVLIWDFILLMQLYDGVCSLNWCLEGFLVPWVASSSLASFFRWKMSSARILLGTLLMMHKRISKWNCFHDLEYEPLYLVMNIANANQDHHSKLFNFVRSKPSSHRRVALIVPLTFPYWLKPMAISRGKLIQFPMVRHQISLLLLIFYYILRHF